MIDTASLRAALAADHSQLPWRDEAERIVSSAGETVVYTIELNRPTADAALIVLAANSLPGLLDELVALRAAAKAAFDAMDVACRWAAGEATHLQTRQQADRHIAGYDALVDATARLGFALGVLHPIDETDRAALTAQPKEG